MYQYQSYQTIVGGSLVENEESSPAVATVFLLKDGNRCSKSGCGDNVFNAVLDAITKIYGKKIGSVNYKIDVVGSLDKVICRAILFISNDHSCFNGEAEADDPIKACALAYITAMNQAKIEE